jgi:hypothetical protein
LASAPSITAAHSIRSSAPAWRELQRNMGRCYHVRPRPLTRYTAKLPSQWPPS